jgi:hypothetical protein
MAFGGCQHVEPDCHQLEIDERRWLTAAETEGLSGGWSGAGSSSPKIRTARLSLRFGITERH